MSLIISSLFLTRSLRKRGKGKIFESHVYLVSRLVDLIWVLLGLRLIFRIEDLGVLMRKLGESGGLLMHYMLALVDEMRQRLDIEIHKGVSNWTELGRGICEIQDDIPDQSILL